MTGTYRAVEVSAPGTLQVVERALVEPRAGQVRIRVDACGVCHTDAATVTGAYRGLTLPRVPGHEVVGRVAAIGPEVAKWAVGQLAFSVQEHIRPMIETRRLDQAAEAYARMMAGEARFRMVLTMNDSPPKLTNA